MRKNIRERGVKLLDGRSCSSISVSEKNRKFTVVLDGASTAKKIHVDNEPYVSLLACRCDYAIEVCRDVSKQVFFFIELKGEDVVKAAEQLAYTVEHLSAYRHLLDYKPFVKCHACIVASHGMKPAISTRFQLYERQIKRRGFESLKCKTHQLTAKVSSGGEVSYE